MYDSRTVRQGYVIVAGYIKRFFMLAGDSVRRTLVKRLVLFIFQLFSRICGKHLISCFFVLCKRREHGIKKRLRHIIGITVDTFYLRIRLLRIYAQTQVRGERPRRSRPCKKICILPGRLKPDNG